MPHEAFEKETCQQKKSSNRAACVMPGLLCTYEHTTYTRWKGRISMRTMWTAMAGGVFISWMLAAPSFAQTKPTLITLTWMDNSDSASGRGSDEDGFIIYLRDASSSTNPSAEVGRVGRNVTAFTRILYLDNSVTNCFSVSAFNKAGESEKSLEACLASAPGTVAAIPFAPSGPALQ
jgi:hypothetical protein